MDVWGYRYVHRHTHERGIFSQYIYEIDRRYVNTTDRLMDGWMGGDLHVFICVCVCVCSYKYRYIHS